MVEIAIHSSVFSGCGSRDLYLTASVTSLFPNSPILQLTVVVLLLQVSAWAFQVAWPLFLSIQAQKFGGFFAFSHSSFMLSLSDLPHVHPFISTLQVQALAVSWSDFKSVTSLVTSCLYTSAPSSRLLELTASHTPFCKRKSSSKPTCYYFQRSSLIHNYISMWPCLNYTELFKSTTEFIISAPVPLFYAVPLCLDCFILFSTCGTHSGLSRPRLSTTNPL